jgi:2-dehydro-3-deoxyphosphogluconate aldolase/(4S)-4-hydroxy-2-oxoglutarate aldolase
MSFMEALHEMPVIAVIRASTANDYPRIILALVAGGIRAVEVTLTTPGTLEVLADLRAGLPEEVYVGVGTVRSARDARIAMENGADFLVSPHTDREIVSAARERDVPVFPGALTPTEVNLALQSGATAVKLFPAGATTPELAKQLLGPFPELSFLPSGGISLEDVAPWLSAGALAVCVGGPLVGTAGTPADEITRRARLYAHAVAAVREAA